MAKFLALLLATAAAFGYVQAQCTPNAVLCGTTIMNVEQCESSVSSLTSKRHTILTTLSGHHHQQQTQKLHLPRITTATAMHNNNNNKRKTGADESTLVFLTPQGNPAINCAFHTNSAGEPQARGAFCCAEGRCSQQGDNAICD